MDYNNHIMIIPAEPGLRELKITDDATYKSGAPIVAWRISTSILIGGMKVQSSVTPLSIDGEAVDIAGIIRNNGQVYFSNGSWAWALDLGIMDVPANIV